MTGERRRRKSMPAGRSRGRARVVAKASRSASRRATGESDFS